MDNRAGYSEQAFFIKRYGRSFHDPGAPDDTYVDPFVAAGWSSKKDVAGRIVERVGGGSA